MWYKEICAEIRAKGNFKCICDYHDGIIDYVHPHIRRYFWQIGSHLKVHIAFHEILTADPWPVLHDHGRWFQTLILEGSYEEQLIEGVYKRETGYNGFMDAHRLHRIYSVEKPCWTMWTFQAKADKELEFMVDGKLVNQQEWVMKNYKVNEVHCPKDFIAGDPKNFRWSDTHGCMVQIIS
jgi:hypothetical protein